MLRLMSKNLFRQEQLKHLCNAYHHRLAILKLALMLTTAHHTHKALHSDHAGLDRIRWASSSATREANIALRRDGSIHTSDVHRESTVHSQRKGGFFFSSTTTITGNQAEGADHAIVHSASSLQASIGRNGSGSRYGRRSGSSFKKRGGKLICCWRQF